MTGNPLVAAPVDVTTPFSGTGILESGESLCTAIQSGDWVAGGISAFSLALDTVGMVLDPIGSLISMGLGWVIDHIDPIKSWFNDLTGDAGEVLGFAGTWHNIASHLETTGQRLGDSLSRLAGMQGAAADAYRAFHGDVAEHLAATGRWAAAIGTGMEIASSIVKMVHDMTRDALTTIIGTVSSAALTTVVTLGFGAPVAVAQVTSKVASLAGKLTKFVTNLVRSIGDLTKLIDDLAALFSRLATTLRNALRSSPGGDAVPTPAATRPTIRDNAAKGEAWADQNAALDADYFDGFQREITVRPNVPEGSPPHPNVRFDGIGYEPGTTVIRPREYKASETAPFTPNQTTGYPLITEHGGVVVGTGKGDFVGGVVIPPGTRIDVIRPNTGRLLE